MFFQNERGTELINSDFVERFCTVERDDAVLVIASYGADRSVTLGRYATPREAEEALSQILTALNDGYSPRMPTSSIGSIGGRSENYHGKKKKSHGGS